ncbi:MAG: hypothetical protein P8Y10_13360, partial [Gemmatimonadales bacterium]
YDEPLSEKDYQKWLERIQEKIEKLENKKKGKYRSPVVEARAATGQPARQLRPRAHAEYREPAIAAGSFHEVGELGARTLFVSIPPLCLR